MLERIERAALFFFCVPDATPASKTFFGVAAWALPWLIVNR
jgi:hypothetical protein